MLLEFNINNFRCFRDRIDFSMIASKDSENLENIFQVNGDPDLRVLKSAVVYGANASGKTNLFKAISFAKSFISKSAKYSPKHRINYKPFILDKITSEKSSMFEFVFIKSGVRYQYGFEILYNEVLEEWLYSYPNNRQRKLFVREMNDAGKKIKYKYKYSTYLKGEKRKLEEITKSNSLFLSVGATFNNEQLEEVYSWFIDDLNIVYADDEKSSNIFSKEITDEYYNSRIGSLLSNADFGIVDMEIEEIDMMDMFSSEDDTEDMPDDQKHVFDSFMKFIEAVGEAEPEIIEKLRYKINFVHQGEETKVLLPFNFESAGTKQLLRLSIPLLKVLKDGGVIFIDEFDRSLHPNLSRTLIKLFNNENVNVSGAQLIFNTHDTAFLSQSLFRRDQIWFVEKTESGNSYLYSLTDYSPRKNEAIEKGYIQGRYGAIPFIGDIRWGNS